MSIADTINGMNKQQLRTLREQVDSAIEIVTAKEDEPRPGTFHVAGSYGTIEADMETGAVTRIHHEDERWVEAVDMKLFLHEEGYFDVTRLDVVEWRHYWSETDMTKGVDVLDFGFWSSVEGYNEASKDFREEVKREKTARSAA